MSVAENTKTVSKYNWRDLNPRVVEAYATTVIKESHRLPDSWGFQIGEEGLIDPKWNAYVHDVIKKFPHPNLYLRRVEDGVIDAMDGWAISDESDPLVWISPVFRGVYPTNKIEIIQKIPGSAETINVAILFDGSSEVCLFVIKSLFSEFKNVRDVEEIRSSVMIKHNLNMDFVLKTIEPFILKSKKIAHISNKTLSYITSLAISGANQAFIAKEMERLEMIGEQSFSCPGGTGLMSVLDANSIALNARDISKYVKNCGSCGAAIDNFISKGYVCSRCGGIYEGC